MAHRQEVLEIIRGTEKGNFFGIMENIIQVNGKREESVARGIGSQPQMKIIWDNGQMVKLMDMAFTL